jgi:inorganic triphosphatase YgiF
MGQEVELKFIGPEDALARLRRSPQLRRLARKRQLQTAVLHAVYFDTDSFALRDAGYGLRVRTENGGFVQTVKSSRGHDVATRREEKAEVAGFAPNLQAIPDDGLRRRVAKAIEGEALRPVFSVEMRRTTVLLIPRRGIEIEAAFDSGTIRTMDEKPASAPISEFELELVKGDANDLFACARELTADLPLTFFLQSKAERGYGLALEAAEAPVGAARLVLPADTTADDAFGRIVAHCLSQFLGNWPAVMIARDPEGIHQMRVALRRMRSAFSLFGGSFRTAMHRLEEEVRWIAGVLGHARDLDVFQEDVYGPAAEAHGDDGRLLELATVVRTRRRIAWADVFEALESERFRQLVLELAAATYSKPWLDASIGGTRAVSPALDLACERLGQRHAQALKLGRRVEDLDAGERHRLRIRLKKLRYAMDFFQSLFKRRAVRKYLKRLSALQDVLGRMNDASVARTLVRDILAEHGDDGGAAAIGYAGGVVAGWHLGHSRARAKSLLKEWRRFAKLTPPWE